MRVEGRVESTGAGESKRRRGGGVRTSEGRGGREKEEERERGRERERVKAKEREINHGPVVTPVRDVGSRIDESDGEVTVAHETRGAI